jgi:Family of unknown function (DUF5696)
MIEVRMIKRIHRKGADRAVITPRLAGHATSLRGLCVLCVSAVMICLFLPQTAAQELAREQWGAPAVNVSQTNGKWTIAGKRNTVTLNESDLAMKVQAASVVWQMVPSTPTDMLVRANDRDTYVRLADAAQKTITRYDTGFKTGVKVVLSGWRNLDLALILTIALEGRDEELVFDAVAREHNAAVRQLDWPTALDARDVDYTLLSNGRGTLLPRAWPKEYYPIRTITPEGKIAATDHSLLQSNVIESWSMAWWGFQKGKAAMMIVIETPDDAAYQFSHPAGGPTVVGPRWLAQLGHFGYPRSGRMSFFADGNYVDMAKRYRRYVMDTGLFVPLTEKIARTPGVKDLIGTPQTRLSILRNMSPDSDRFDTKDPAKNYSLTTFAERAKQLRDLKARGFDSVLVFISGWPHLGYDRQHPDSLPPPEKAGGWEGFKRLVDTARELGYPYILHDQYRDYYLDAPSYDPQFAVREESTQLPAQAFPGSRFGDSKDGDIPMMRHWDGGRQAYLNNRFWLGHLLKNYQLFFEQGIKPQGIYLDVIGYVPPDEDFNPDHPTTRSQAMAGRAATMTWSRHNLGIVATEAGADWVIPYVDVINQSGGGSKAILVPLYNLVYHDAVIVSYGARDEQSLLRGILNGGVPELPISATDEKTLSLMRQMMALHKRVALLEMTRHDFLDQNYRHERTTFADGTTVTVDWDTNTFTINPALSGKL